MEFVDVAAARGMDGLRVALVRGVPSPWGMAAKAMFEHHNIPFVIVEQKGASQTRNWWIGPGIGTGRL